MFKYIFVIAQHDMMWKSNECWQIISNKKVDLASLKLDGNEIDIDELNTVHEDLDKWESKVNKMLMY